MAPLLRSVAKPLAAIGLTLLSAGCGAGATPGTLSAAERAETGSDVVWIAEMTWLEVRDAIASGKKVAIVPSGGLEQNGPYLVTGKHNLVVGTMCEAIARELGNALCAPVVQYVPQGDPEEIEYPGTLSVRDTTFRALLADVAESARSQGFEDIVFIGDSGGNQAGMREVAAAMDDRWLGEGRAHYIPEYYSEDIWSCDFLKEELGIVQQPDVCSATRGLYHDDVHYSAIVAVADPELIRASRRIAAGLYSINGVDLGPVERTQEIGRRLIEYRTGIAVRAIRERLTRPVRSDEKSPE